jgi:hypothetical protein
MTREINTEFEIVNFLDNTHKKINKNKILEWHCGEILFVYNINVYSSIYLVLPHHIKDTKDVQVPASVILLSLQLGHEQPT